MIKFDENRVTHTTLGELVSKEKKSIISGPFGSNVGKKFFKEEGIPLIRGNNLSKGEEKFKDDGFVFLTREKADELNCYAIKNDLIFTAVGTIGQVGIIDEKLKYDEYVISNKQLRARFDNTKITPLFAYYWFSSYWVQKLILQRNVGSTVPLINLSVLKGLPITLPKSIETQKSIVEVLENISLKIEVNNNINQELEAMAKTLYDYWFVQFDFPDANGKPYKSSGGKMIFNEALKREIPEGWEVDKLRNIAKTGSGATPLKSKKEYYENGNIPWINSGEVNASFIISAKKYISELGLEESSAKLFKKGTILMAMYGATAGQVSLIDIEACTNQAICGINVHEEKFKYYTKFALEDLYKYLIQLSTGSARDNLSQDKIKELNLVIPDDQIISNFHNKVDSNFTKILLNLKENQKLSELRDWLLPMLMNGQVRVAHSHADGNLGEVKQELGMVAEEGEKYGK
ncbi:restriction endonuclease subunit S [Winogradskyella sp.]|uniref:restriction endonuclease subunit S n=1 Tax=Winogradskyella sp. TaxID=1883156 RepID=UPI003AB56718